MITSLRSFLRVPVLVLCLSVQSALAADWYIDGHNGLDSNDGTSPETAWKTLSMAANSGFGPGDRILLKRGSRFDGSIVIKSGGTADQPLVIAAYGEGSRPLVNASGYRAGVWIMNASHVVVRDLEITGDGGRMVDGSPERERFGVLVSARKKGTVNHVTIRDLYIHDIYPGIGSPHEGRRETSHLGYGIAVRGTETGGSSDILIEGCRIERTGFKAIELKNVNQVRVLDNHMKDIGGPAIQPGVVEDLIVRGNSVDGSGSFIDPRMHGRGSGIWPWTAKRILIERNTFKGARGKADSCGIHIDFNCTDVVVQYNLSLDNEGGFVEILGNNHNSIYRYNISINDGARVKGEDGAHQEGKIVWTSGYVGRNRKKTGPTNSYIYNNTIYVGPGSRSCFSITGTTDGLLVANNIFHLLGETANVLGDQDWRKDEIVDRIERADVRNNVVIRSDLLPDSLPFDNLDPVVGDVRFRQPGGTLAEDYIPQNIELIRDRGIPVVPLEGDDGETVFGFSVRTDYFGNPIIGLPDIGAIEIQPSIN